MFGGPPPKITEDMKIKKPSSIKEVPGYLKKVIGGFFSRYVYIFKLVWQTSPFITFAMSFAAIFNGVFPVAGAYITAGLLNEIVEAFNLSRELISSLSGAELAMRVLSETKIILYIVLQFGYLVLNSVISTAYNAIINISGEKVANHIKLKIITKAKEIDVSQFDLPEFYEKFENASREAGFRPIQILSATFEMISNVISVVSFIVVLAGLSIWAPLAVFILALPAAVVRMIYSRKNFLYARRHSKERRHMEYYSQVLTNKDLVKEVRILNLSDTFIDKFKNTFKKYFRGLKSLVIRENVWHVLISLVSALVNSALFLFITYKVCIGELLVGDFSLYSNSLKSIISCVGAIVATTATIYQGTLFIDNMIDFTKVQAKIVPTVNPPLQVKRHIEHTIEFKDVCFSYPGSNKLVLKNINFKLEGGKTCVLVGLNGAGKTTLIKLLTRLYDPTSGVIMLDGKDIREYDLKELYSIYGIIFQDFGKYAVNVDENIYFGDIDKGFNESDVITAAKQSGASEFIEKLPKQYSTPLMKYFEDDGVELSIGQWQKLSVARAFYSDSDILILDEPTASLDAIAEQQIFSQFDELRKGKTTIFVSHRLSSATTADVILVIENGEIVEMGNHSSLMKLKGKYYTLFTTQAKRYITESENTAD